MQINANKIRIDWIILTTNYITPLLRCVFLWFPYCNISLNDLRNANELW